MSNNKNKKILFTGGGTGGSVSPLLAIYDELKDASNYNFLWIGTKSGLEKEMVTKEGIEYKSINAGKFRRYFSYKNISDIFLIKIGFFQSLWIILKTKPDLIISAGSFISVPVVWAGWLLGIKIIIHQQDLRPGLANKLMSPAADIITVTFEKSLKDYGKKAVWTGNPIRRQFSIKENLFKFKNNLPTILIVGGGTGAESINVLVYENLDELTKYCNVIHISGKKRVIKNKELIIRNNNYKTFEFLDVDKMASAYMSSSLVITRAGLGVLTEVSLLGKPAIIIPLPNSHQEDNANIFKEKKAAKVLNQKELNKNIFLANIKELLNNKVKQEEYKKNIKKIFKKDSNTAIIVQISKLLLT